MAKGRILFIDDDNFLRKVYQAELSEKGFEVHLAVDGEDGLQKIAELKPDLIILDLIMPKKNGFEVLEDLQRFKETKTIPVIVLSNLAQSDDQKKALDLGAVDYLIKDNTTLDIIAEKIDFHLHTMTKKPVVSTPAPEHGESIKEAIKKKTRTHVATPHPAASPLKKEKEESSDRGHNFCPNCGFKLKGGEKFCPNCGQQL